MKILICVLFNFLLIGCSSSASHAVGTVIDIVGAINEEQKLIAEDPCIKMHWDKRDECRKKRQKEVEEMAEAMKKDR